MAHVMRLTLGTLRPAVRSAALVAQRRTVAPAVAGSDVGPTGALVQARCMSSKPERPLSPHLTIYKFGVNAITSVGHRGTGIFMAGALGMASIGLLGASHDVAHYVECMRSTGWMLPLAKMAVAGPISYHFMTGIRHVLWDHIIAHDLELSYKSSYVIVGLSGAITLGAAFAEF